MMKTDNILDEFHRRPAMYTGERSLTSICHFLSGYSFAMWRNEISTDNDPLVLPLDFHDWVAYRLHFYKSTSGWCTMIIDRTGTEEEAIDTFFRLLAEYKSRRPHTVAKLINFTKTYSGQNVCRNENGEFALSPVISRDYPKSISLVTYTDDAGFFAYSDDEVSLPWQGYFPDLTSFEFQTGTDRSMLTIIDSLWDPKPFQRTD